MSIVMQGQIVRLLLCILASIEPASVTRRV